MLTTMNLKQLSPEQIQSQVYDLLVDRLGVRRSELAPQRGLVKDLGADSLDSVELIMALEQKFHIRITNEQAERIKTVGDILNYINSYTDK